MQKIKKYKEIIIWKFFERNFARNCVKNGFFLQNNSVENSLICPRAKSSNHCLTELFSIYQNKHWTIRQRDDHIVVSSSNRIKSKIDWILIRSWSTLQRGWNIVSNDGQLQYWATFRQCYLLYIHKQEHVSFSSPKKDYQTAYEEKILCLFTVTLLFATQIFGSYG